MDAALASAQPPTSTTMYAISRSLTIPRRSAWGLNVFYGGLVIAIADGIFFSTFWSLRGVSPLRILQTIAAGLIGREASYTGGAATMALGAGLHLFIAVMFVLVYAAVGRRVPALLRRPFVFGPPYGLVVFLLMSYVVVPLSRLGPPTKPEDTSWLIGSIAFHVIVVGLASACFARRAWGGSARTH
jgi:hypothetical protein